MGILHGLSVPPWVGKWLYSRGDRKIASSVPPLLPNQQQTWSGINDETERQAEKGGKEKVACPLLLVLFVAWSVMTLKFEGGCEDGRVG